jgi:hypothetical protein
MNTQVTQKKKLTLRTQKPGDNAGEAGASAEDAAPAFRRVTVDSSYHTPGAVIAIIASVIVLSLIALQAIEWAYYKAPPTVWPPKPAGAVR